MRYLLVTTVKRGAPVEKSGAAYIYDLENGKVVSKCGMLPLQARFPRNPRGGIRGLRGACIDEKAKEIYITTNDTITALDYKLNMLYSIQNRLFSNLHDVVKTPEGYFIVASCGNDSIFRYRPGFSVDQLWGAAVSKTRNYSVVDRHGEKRPNSLFLNGGDLYFVCANDSFIFKINLPTRTHEKIRIGKSTDANSVFSPHNVGIGDEDFFGDDLMFYNQSGEAQLCCLNGKEESVVFEDKKPWYYINSKKTQWGWLRGMDIVRDRMVIGSSPYARVLLFYLKGKPDKIIRISRNKYEAVYSVNFFRNGL